MSNPGTSPTTSFKRPTPSWPHAATVLGTSVPVPNRLRALMLRRAAPFAAASIVAASWCSSAALMLPSTILKPGPGAGLRLGAPSTGSRGKKKIADVVLQGAVFPRIRAQLTRNGGRIRAANVQERDRIGRVRMGTLRPKSVASPRHRLFSARNYRVGSGEGGIRTRGGVSPTQHFQCCTIDHSVTSPTLQSYFRQPDYVNGCSEQWMMA